MRIYIYELSEEEKDLHFTHKDAWVMETVETTQESPLDKPTDFSLDFSARRLQEVVFLNGKFDLDLGLLCSRCANPFDQHIDGDFKYLYTRRPKLQTHAGSSHGGAISHDDEDTDTGSSDPELEYLEKDYIELEDVLKEQIYLKIPVQPLCSEDCKGVCPVCGQDRNKQPCQCHRIKNTALANALKNFKQ